MDRRSLGMKNEVWKNERESARNLYFARADQQVDRLESCMLYCVSTIIRSSLVQVCTANVMGKP